MRYAKRRVKARKSSRKTKPTKTRTAKRAFKVAVLKIVKKQREDKQAYFSTGDTLVSCNSGISGGGDMQQLVPNIANGTADNQRIGDQVTARSMNLKGFVRLFPKTQTGSVVNEPKLSNVVVRMMVVSLKVAPNYSIAVNQAGQLTGILKKGGTVTSFSGTLSDVMAPINTDLFTVHKDKKFYLTQDYVFVPSSTAGTYVNSAVAIDERKAIKFFNFNIKCKNKTLKYDVTPGSLVPTNWGPFLVIGYAYLDGSSPDVINTQVGLQYTSTLNYEDA